jgi:alanine racemase
MNNARTWAEINAGNLKHNFNEVKKRLKPDTKIMAVVKADAYGHGAEKCSHIFEDCGADFFGVACIDEALNLRESGITKPILVLGYIPYDRIDEALLNKITCTVYNIEFAAKLSERAVSLNVTANIHIKIDTGMGRIGFLYGYNNKEDSNTINEICEIVKLPGLYTEGIFTHFSNADDPQDEKTPLQYEHFLKLIDCLSQKSVDFKIKHCCNSASILRYPYMQMDMVRPGIILYGCLPDKCLEEGTDFKYAMTLKSTVINIKNVSEGFGISYGEIYKTSGKTRVATIPIGYADGFPRILGNMLSVYVNGSYAKIIGRICMDQCMIDVTCVNNINVGDEVTIFGYGCGAAVPVEILSELCSTISYEIICNIGKRVPRIYV